MPRRALVLAALLIAASPAGALTLRQVWQAGPPVEAFDAYGIAFVDLFGTGPVFLGQNDDARTYVIDLDGDWAAHATQHPNGTTWHTRTRNGIAVDDLDGDGALDVVVVNSGGYLTRFEVEGGALQERWNRSLFGPDLDPDYWDTHPWEERTPAAERKHIAHGHAAIAAPEDGVEPWIFVATDDMDGVYAFDADGQLVWEQAWFDAHAGPWVGRLTPEDPWAVVFGTDGGMVIAMEADTGAPRWRFHVDAVPGSISVPPTVVDLDGDGVAEVFAAARVGVDDGSPGWQERQRARLYLLDAHGAELWNTTHPEGNPMVHSEAVPWDVQGDGVLDLVVLDWNTIGDRPGDGSRLGPGNLFALDGRDGSLLWTTHVDAPRTDFMLAGAWFWSGAGWDARFMVPHAAEGVPGVATYAASTGARLDWAALPAGWDATRGVALVDLDGNGWWEAIVRIERPSDGCIPKWDVPCREGAFAVFSTEAKKAFALGHTTRSAGSAGWTITASPLGPGPTVEPAAPRLTGPPTEPADESAVSRPASWALVVSLVALALAAWRKNL